MGSYRATAWVDGVKLVKLEHHFDDFVTVEFEARKILCAAPQLLFKFQEFYFLSKVLFVEVLSNIVYSYSIKFLVKCQKCISTIMHCHQTMIFFTDKAYYVTTVVVSINNNYFRCYANDRIILSYSSSYFVVDFGGLILVEDVELGDVLVRSQVDPQNERIFVVTNKSSLWK